MAWAKTQVAQSEEWIKPKKDLRRFRELIDLWFDLHGMQLKRGIERKKALIHMCDALGNPIASTIDANMFATYRKERLEGKHVPLNDKRKRSRGISVNSANREHAYLRSMFNELRRVGQWSGPNPIEHVRQFKVDEQELSYLSLADIAKLLASLEKGSELDALLVTKVCLAIGARWSEAVNLRRSQLRGGKVQLAKTKSGKIRAIPIAEDLERELLNFSNIRVDRKSDLDEPLFRECYGAFREAVERAKITLPKGQLTHVLRHTFASHFMMAGGNILTLQRVLGHADLKTTMRYAHLSPEHLQESVRLNPLAQLHLTFTSENEVKQLKPSTLRDLIAQCDITASEPNDMALWRGAPAVGKEVDL
ncbi:tyrosine-type recombinase/integrase [Herbaspirillum sp. GCM10030257]|uniref:phage integrase n=1 Tax=Herbaspirillum sp. GCM10030257 TaxID=3273393 RepID=UPI0036154682